MKSTDFYDLVSGRRRGVGAAAMRAGLALVEGPYRLGVWWRNRRFDRQAGAVQRIDVPVISVGNLTLGGTGKTPIVKWLARRLREEGRRVAIVSRGYGAEPGEKNDEALEIEQSLPDVPHLQNPDRVEAARAAVEELGAEVVVMDDGFQHRRLGRDFDLVLLDATQPFGFGRVFPRGALREPIGSLRRADAVCLTRSDLVDAATRETIRKRVDEVAPNTLWCESVTSPGRLLGVGEQPFKPPPTQPIQTLRGMRVGAFCGIGNPRAFRRSLESLGAEVASFREYPDHHAFTREDIDALASDVAQVEALICTHKDLVKVGVKEIGGRPLWAVEIEAEITVGAEALWRGLQGSIEAGSSTPPAAGDQTGG